MDRLAIVVPCYNEEEMLPISSEALRNKLNELVEKGLISEDSFVLFVDDGSKDATWELIEKEHNEHKQIMGLKLAGNVGHQFALTLDLPLILIREFSLSALNCDRYSAKSTSA